MRSYGDLKREASTSYGEGRAGLAMGSLGKTQRLPPSSDFGATGKAECRSEVLEVLEVLEKTEVLLSVTER